MCNISKFERIDAYSALKHPFITRDKSSRIPESYTETYYKKQKIKDLKLVRFILIFVFFNFVGIRPYLQFRRIL